MSKSEPQLSKVSIDVVVTVNVYQWSCAAFPRSFRAWAAVFPPTVEPHSIGPMLFGAVAMEKSDGAVVGPALGGAVLGPALGDEDGSDDGAAVLGPALGDDDGVDDGAAQQHSSTVQQRPSQTW